MFKKVILENQIKIKELDFIKRDLNIDEIISVFNLNKIIAFIWARRAWKTFFTFQIANELVKKEIIKLEQIIYIDFSWFVEKNIDFEKVLEDYFIIYPDFKPFFILDEVQELINFPEKLISLLNKWYKIIITWSNAHLLSKELSTILRWKVYEKEIFPLDFREFLRFKNIEYNSNDFILSPSKYKKAFLEYLKWWWFPEITLTANEIAKETILKGYLDVMIYKDLQDRYSIKNDYSLSFFIKRLLWTYTKEFNINKIYNELKWQQIRIGKDSLYNFYEYLQNIYFMESLKNYWAKIKWLTKPYLIDISFSNLVSFADMWKRFENIIYLELKKKFNGIYFLNKNYEVDFFIPQENLYIQVVYDLNQNNYEREVINLLKQDWKKMVIYFEKDQDIKLDNNINFLNFFDFIF